MASTTLNATSPHRSRESHARAQHAHHHGRKSGFCPVQLATLSPFDSVAMARLGCPPLGPRLCRERLRGGMGRALWHAMQRGVAVLQQVLAVCHTCLLTLLYPTHVCLDVMVGLL